MKTMRCLMAFIVLFLAISFTACSDGIGPELEITIEEEIPLGFQVGVNVINSRYLVGLGFRVDPSNSETFGVSSMAYQGNKAMLEIGPDGEFQIFAQLGEHELRWFSTSVDSVTRATFSGTFAPRAVKNPSIVFHDLRVVANVAELFTLCQISPPDTPSLCWSQRGNQIFAGDVTVESRASGYFKGEVEGSGPYNAVTSVRAGVVLSGTCNKDLLDRYMVVEGRNHLVQYSNTNPSYGFVRQLGGVYLEVTCRAIATPASLVALPVQLIWTKP